MTATILLIRHAAHGHLGEILTGRLEGAGLTAEGQQQARRLASMIRHERLAAVQSSQSLRAQQTALVLSKLETQEIETADALAEVDFGEWTGRSFAELEQDSHWHEWNARRATAAAPGGETMLAVQERAWRHVAETACKFSGAVVAMVSHCDVIRAVIAKVLGLSLNNLLRFDIAPASISRLAVGEWGEKVISINEQAA